MRFGIGPAEWTWDGLGKLAEGRLGYVPFGTYIRAEIGRYNGAVGPTYMSTPTAGPMPKRHQLRWIGPF